MDMAPVDQLQNEIGEEIENLKNRDKDDIEMFSLLDDKLYEFFLDIKSDFNKRAPLDKDASCFGEIRNRFDDILKQFIDENVQKSNAEIEKLCDSLKMRAEEWNKEHMSSEISSEMNLTPGSTFMPLPLKGSVTVENMVKEPQLDSGAASPVMMGFKQKL